MAGVFVLAFATSGLIRPQSNVWVGMDAGLTSFDGMVSTSFKSVSGYGLETAHRFGDRDLGGQPLHARCTEEADHALGPLQHVGRVLGLCDRTAVAEHHHGAIDR